MKPHCMHLMKFPFSSGSAFISSNHSRLSFLFPADYDTNKTVKCTSEFVYDETRQRSLQHLIR